MFLYVLYVGSFILMFLGTDENQHNGVEWVFIDPALWIWLKLAF